MNQKEIKNNRMALLHTLLAQSPEDPFPRYGLAVEYVSTGEMDKARGYFQELLEKFPAYVPTYYQFARLAWQEGSAEEAIALVKTGIERATAAGEKNALRELQMLLEEFD